MNRRNWLDLSRKLVDRFDLDYTLNAIQEALGEQARSYWGEGVLITTLYPNPFLVTRSNSVLGGSVSDGIAYDANGQLTEISPTSSTSKDFTLEPADATYARWDLLCLKYVATGDTPVPKPSDPISIVSLNLHDDFELVVVEGTPANSPVYPAKGDPLLVVLAGIRIPANSTLGTQCTVDYSVREQANANVVGAPVFVQEVPSGAINGSNATFTLSEVPFDNSSLLVILDGLTLPQDEWSLSGAQTVILDTAPALGQSLECYYVADSGSSQNPLSGRQEVPSGVVDGVNDTFALTNKAANQDSVLVFVDGMVSETTEWQLIQTTNSTKVQFLPGSIPVAGQSVYVFYLVNAFALGQITGALTPITENFTIGATELSDKFVTLAHNPANPTTVLCDIIGNTGQIYGVDFSVSGNQLSWDTLGMDGILFSGSKLRVFYLY